MTLMHPYSFSIYHPAFAASSWVNLYDMLHSEPMEYSPGIYAYFVLNSK